MSSQQRTVCVERAVMHALRRDVLPSGVNVPLEDKAYANFEVDPAQYSDVDTFKRVYLVASFLRKWKGLRTGNDLEREALSKWISAEHQCLRTNRRLELEASTGNFSVAPSIISDAQRKILQVLGDLNQDKLDVLCRFGNGATVDLKHGSTHAEKMLQPSVTIDAIPGVCRALSGDPYMQELVGGLQELKIVDYNRMVMVPKNCKTHRVIAAEPTLNSFVQQGYGRHIRKRLKRFGVDLDDQTINQDLAFRALVDGYSTIDLSSASDTLCINLVKLLLPDNWYMRLSKLRSPKTRYKGTTVHLQKFSSMGNAYTFELESMIFWALCRATVGDHDVVSVYGDDIVVPWHRYESVVKTLTWAGFDVNYDKSFTEGSRFFESCGKHYFDIEEVTPAYQKDVCTRPVDYVRLHNRLVRAGIRLGLRMELRAATRIVRERYAASFPRLGVDTGPLVEYDEYFIDEDWVWPEGVDRVKLKSWVTISDVNVIDEDLRHKAYLGRKLRQPSFLNPDPHGQASESGGHTLKLRHKWHWRSASL